MHMTILEAYNIADLREMARRNREHLILPPAVEFALVPPKASLKLLNTVRIAAEH